MVGLGEDVFLWCRTFKVPNFQGLWELRTCGFFAESVNVFQSSRCGWVKKNVAEWGVEGERSRWNGEKVMMGGLGQYNTLNRIT